MTVISQGYDAEVHLNIRDIVVDNAEAPEVMTVTIKTVLNILRPLVQ